MNTGQREKVKEVFSSAADLPPAERSAYLNGACDGDREVQAEVESLLAAEDLPPLPVGVGALVPRGGVGMLGRLVGNYAIKALIGEGGMGVVYLAEQEQPKRDVALKVMRAGIASTSALRRFKEESQTLARLEHEGIARIYESGVHDAGGERVPYFAMEYIADAKPITEYAKEKSLSAREKLELFAKVCDAVQFGHQKGIIHRDLKPQNILVGCGGAPKVIDFGVAKSIGSDQTATSLHTGTGRLIGTLQYMSPEQLRADPHDPHDVDTRSDVYALGVVLYELLAGRQPYAVSGSSLAQAARVIEERAPAALGGIDPRLRGDVETITCKVMEKERGRRYQTAAELAEDVRRYLRNDPISARRASASYQIRMFARKHKGACWGSMAAGLGIVAGLIGASYGLVRANAASTSAATATKFLLDGLESLSTDPKGLTAAAILAEMGERVDAGHLDNQPAIKARVLRAMAVVLAHAGLQSDAEIRARQALGIERTLHRGDHSDVAASLGVLANALVRQDRPEQAVKMQAEALRMYESLNPGDHPIVAVNLRFLGYMMEKQSEAERSTQRAASEESARKAEAFYLRSLAMRQRLVAANHPGVEEYRKLTGFDRTRAGPGDDEEIANTLNGLGWVRHTLGHDDDAVDAFTDTTNMNLRLHGNGMPGVAQPLTLFADHLVHECEKRDPSRAEGLYVTALRIQEMAHGTDHQDRASTLADLARCRVALGRLPEALVTAESAAEMANRILPEGNEVRVKCHRVLTDIEQMSVGVRGDAAEATRRR